MLSPDKITSGQNFRDDISGVEEAIDIEKLTAIARRQWRVFALCVVAFAIVGLAYVLTAVPLFTATASLLIDKGDNGLVNRLTLDGGAVDDEASILSQVEVLKSDTIGLAVVDKLNLSNDPVFMAVSKSPLASMKQAASSVLNVSKWFVEDTLKIDEAEENRRVALANIQNNMAIERVGRSYVLGVSFTSPSGEMSARVANAIADAYITDKLDAKYDATRRASDWLQARIDELKDQVRVSDLAVQKYRADNGLLAAGGQLISDQQLTELNSSLLIAQSNTAQAKAKVDRIQQILDTGQTDAIVTDVLASSVSTELRQKYLDASKLEADISRRLGPDHVQAVRLRAEMKEYERLMFGELGRIAESYRSEYEVAQSRERSLADQVNTAKNATVSAGETGVQLRELERSADTYRNLYQTFMQRYQEAIQQQSFPITEARIITRPIKPQAPSYPRKPLVLAIFAALGAAAGGGIGALREFRDRYFRTGEQIRDELGLEFLGLSPLIKAVDINKGADTPNSQRSLFRLNNISEYVFHHPLSSFAETLRSAKIAIDLQDDHRSCKVIGIASTLPGEGKSTISMNFADLLAMQGARTLLIDCDLRNPGSTRAIGRHADAGLIEVVLEARPFETLLLVDEKTGLSFLPAVVKRRIPHSSELLSSKAMDQLLERAKTMFDYVVLDLPPLAPVVDSRAIAPKVDDFIYVVEWGRTSRKVVRQTLAPEAEIVSKCVGVVLNKVDTDKMKLYRTYGSSEYYYSRYSAYYNEN